jgi:MatE
VSLTCTCFHAADAAAVAAANHDTSLLPPLFLLYRLLFIAAPLFVEGLAAIGEQLVATSCVGHLPQATALSALVLAQAVYNLMGYSIVSGLASALETLCGQAYGAGNHRLLAVMLVRAQMVCLLAVVPAVVLWGSGSMEALLLLSGQQQQISQPASRCVCVHMDAQAHLRSSITTTLQTPCMRARMHACMHASFCECYYNCPLLLKLAPATTTAPCPCLCRTLGAAGSLHC